MNIFSRTSVLSFFVIGFAIGHACAQEKRLPDILKPGPIGEAEAARLEAKIFKLLPAEMLYKNAPDESRLDKDFPFGVRGGGAFFSFTNETHSFNQNPELHLRPPHLVSGPTTSLVLIRDLGKVSLLSLENQKLEISELLDYKPPKYLKDFGLERTRLDKETLGGSSSGGRLHLRYEIGNVYLLRALTLEKSDIVVVFQVLEAEANGALTIIWRELRRFPPPIALYMSDEAMQAKIDSIIAEEKIVCDRVTVKDNHLYYTADSTRITDLNRNAQLEAALVRRNIRIRGAGGNVPR